MNFSKILQAEQMKCLQDVVGKDGMWNINKLYIDQQLAKGKTFLLSHNPEVTFGNGSDFAKEMSYLLKCYGLSDSVSNFEKYGTFWRVKQ